MQHSAITHIHQLYIVGFASTHYHRCRPSRSLARSLNAFVYTIFAGEYTHTATAKQRQQWSNNTSIEGHHCCFQSMLNVSYCLRLAGNSQTVNIYINIHTRTTPIHRYHTQQPKIKKKNERTNNNNDGDERKRNTTADKRKEKLKELQHKHTYTGWLAVTLFCPEFRYTIYHFTRSIQNRAKQAPNRVHRTQNERRKASEKVTKDFFIRAVQPKI